MKTKALVKIYGGMILSGINLFYLLWISYFFHMLNQSNRWNIENYEGAMQSALSGKYLPEEAWPLHGILLALGVIGVIGIIWGIIQYITSCLSGKEERESNTPKSQISGIIIMFVIAVLLAIIAVATKG